MDKVRIAYLIQKSRSHQATQQETDELEALWLLAQSDQTLLNNLSEEERESIRVAMLHNIKQKIFSEKSREMTVRHNSPALSWALRVAASVTVIAAITFLWLQNRQQHQNEFRTAYGEQMTVRLPDHSLVVINGNSSLRYNRGWDDANREVWIHGEGFFEVTHTEDNQEFVVHTEGGMDVQVLGTKFNVKVRRGKAEVLLQEGKVRVDVADDDAGTSMMLQPGELVVLENQQFQKTAVKAEEYVSWKENRLFFEQTSLRDIAILLEDTYGMNVIFQDSNLAGRRLSGEISVDNASDIVEAIKESLDIGITHDGNTIVIHE